MSAPTLADRARMTDELELLQSAIAERLRRVGVRLPEAELAAVADDVLTDAVAICTDWLERA
jgi:hypothetical protein